MEVNTTVKTNVWKLFWLFCACLYPGWILNKWCPFYL